MEGEQSEIVWEAASCYVVLVVQTSKSGIWSGLVAVQRTEGCPHQREHEEC